MKSKFFVARTSYLLAGLAGAALFVTACSEPAPPPPPPPPPPPTAEAKVETYKRCWDQFNNKAWDQFQNCYTENAISENIGGASATGRTAILERDKGESVAFPDRKGEVRLLLQNADHAATVALWTATNTGEMPGPDGKPMKPTGKSIGLLMGHVIDWDATGTRAARDAGYVEMGTVMAQIGVSKAPARAAEKATGAQATVVIARNDATESANIAASRAGVDAFNKHDTKAMEAMTPDNYKLVEIGQAKDMNKKESLASMKDMFTGFPDVALVTPTVWAAGDYVVTEGTLTGTNTGDLKGMGVKKTGKKVSARFLQIARYENGKVVEEWLFYNGADFAAQLGLK